MADIVFPGQDSGTKISSLPANKDIIVYRGDYLEFFITLKTSNNSPMDLTNFTPKAQIRVNYEDNAPISFTAEKTGVAGQVRLYLPSSTTATLYQNAYVYDFQLTTSDRTRTYLTGDITIYSEVTR